MRVVLVVCSLAMSSAALAGPQCTSESAEKWIPANEMKKKIVALGHHIDVFKTTKGNCYEIYGKNNTGQRIEIYFNPVTGDIVKEAAR